jgi:hypothetical protein
MNTYTHTHMYIRIYACITHPRCQPLAHSTSQGSLYICKYMSLCLHTHMYIHKQTYIFCYTPTMPTACTLDLIRFTVYSRPGWLLLDTHTHTHTHTYAHMHVLHTYDANRLHFRPDKVHCIFASRMAASWSFTLQA